MTLCELLRLKRIKSPCVYLLCCFFFGGGGLFHQNPNFSMEDKYWSLPGNVTRGNFLFAPTRQLQDALEDTQRCPPRVSFLRSVNLLQIPFNWNMGWKIDANPSVEQTLTQFSIYVHPNKRQSRRQSFSVKAKQTNQNVLISLEENYKLNICCILAPDAFIITLGVERFCGQ